MPSLLRRSSNQYLVFSFKYQKSKNEKAGGQLEASGFLMFIWVEPARKRLAECGQKRHHLAVATSPSTLYDI